MKRFSCIAHVVLLCGKLLLKLTLLVIACPVLGYIWLYIWRDPIINYGFMVNIHEYCIWGVQILLFWMILSMFNIRKTIVSIVGFLIAFYFIVRLFNLH